ncbi:hypothetical protein GUJ93_ZPchr0012g21225 [Zizania palustris]|uniref:Uncharacterized protein n=1 Tax=Zizania palustris TaxID=103762 RepID=A0A8J6BRI2_ZIZPA|nr:hypothetical protein GUJ93_ZPchr0012g21225 [Zizania palustris]
MAQLVQAAFSFCSWLRLAHSRLAFYSWQRRRVDPSWEGHGGAEEALGVRGATSSEAAAVDPTWEGREGRRRLRSEGGGGSGVGAWRGGGLVGSEGAAACEETTVDPAEGRRGQRIRQRGAAATAVDPAEGAAAAADPTEGPAVVDPAEGGVGRSGGVSSSGVGRTRGRDGQSASLVRFSKYLGTKGLNIRD